MLNTGQPVHFSVELTPLTHYWVCSVSVSYLETLADLPWEVSSDDFINLDAVNEQLDKDHHGSEPPNKS